MRILFKNNRVIFFSLIAFFFSSALAIFFNEKSNLHLFFNGFVNESLNTFFLNVTYLGDGWIIIGFLLISLFINLRFFVTAGLSYAISSGITQLLKNYFFKAELRPRTYFEQFFPDHPLHLLKGIEIFGENSFPSGHTTAAFSFFVCLSFALHNDWLKFSCFLLALIVGLSRVYLSQHFFSDVVAGALIGSGCAILFSYYFYFRVNSGKYNRIDQSLLKYLFSRPSND
jgi:membrane-associated phospholipid phosphatase